MEENVCTKCGNTILKSNQLLHDLKCTSSSLANNNNLNNNNSNYLLKFNNEPIDNNNNYYICEICGIYLETKDKTDHLLCHELENESKRNNNIFNFNDSINQGNQNRNNRNLNRDSNSNLGLNYLSSEDEDIINDDSSDPFDDISNEGLDEDIINSIPISKIKSITNLSEEQKKCLICLEDYKIGDDSIILPCIHIFHADCIKKWMQKQNICPACKTKINSNNNDNY